MKFGKIKKQHSMLEGLEDLCKQLLKECAHIQRIVHGRINRRKGRGEAEFKVQYPTPAGLKCMYLKSGATQEVFQICSDEKAAQEWLKTRSERPT